MNDVIEKLQTIDSVESLSSFIMENMPALYDLCNAEWRIICACREELESFFLFKHSLITRLDFESQDNRAFILICLDLAQRLNLLSVVPHLVRVVNSHSDQIHLNKRLTAGISYTHPRPRTADDIIEKYSQICTLLQDAIETEEDNNQKCLVTFLNYYSAAVDQLSSIYADELKQRIDASLLNDEYPFLSDIKDLDVVDVTDTILAQEQIQSIISSIFEEAARQSRPVPIDEFIIEEDTQYSRDIQLTQCNFRSIKRLSDNRASGQRISGRGVEQIQAEEGLFDYMRNYGNMHQAKIMSSLVAPFPQQFESKISLIDWGCGQALASMVFMDKFGSDNIKQIILIEPSEMALRRASLHCKRYAPDVPLQTICKEFDELTIDDIHLVEPETTVHLFSNVLDMEDYSVDHLSALVNSLTNSQQYFVCISPHIDDYRTNKIDTFVRKIQHDSEDFVMLNSKTNTKNNEFWNCNNLATRNIRVHGQSQYCGDFSGNPCNNRWTRVMRVFKV